MQYSARCNRLGPSTRQPSFGDLAEDSTPSVQGSKTDTHILVMVISAVSEFMLAKSENTNKRK